MILSDSRGAGGFSWVYAPARGAAILEACGDADLVLSRDDPKPFWQLLIGAAFVMSLGE